MLELCDDGIQSDGILGSVSASRCGAAHRGSSPRWSRWQETTDEGRPWWQKGLFFGALCALLRCWY